MTAPLSAEGEGEILGPEITVPVLPGSQRFAEDIQRYNTDYDPLALARIRTYASENIHDARRWERLARELVIDAQTTDLLLDAAESLLRNADSAADNALGFAILRLDASGFWEEAPAEQRVRFEMLVRAALLLPENRIHPFTRYTAGRAQERMAAAAEAKPAQLLQYQTSRKTFEVIGIEYDALQSVGRMAQALEQIVGDYLLYIDEFPQPLWVRIRPRGDNWQAPPFEIEVSVEGNVGVVLNWDDAISMDAVAQALSRALLQRIAIWRWAQAESEAVPDWLIRALALEIPAHLQPARNQGLVRGIEGIDSLLPLPILLGAQARIDKPDADVALQSLWFYRYLRSQVPNRQIFGLLIEAFLSERDGMQIVQRAFPELDSQPALAQEWWEVGLANLVHRQQGVIYSLAQSDAVLEGLAGVTAWWQGQDRRLRGPALVSVREDARWQSALWRQQRELKLELQRINPVYFNALLSLGQFYDLLLERGGSAEPLSSTELRIQAEAAYARFLEDWAYARTLHRAVDEALASPAAQGRN